MWGAAVLCFAVRWWYEENAQTDAEEIRGLRAGEYATYVEANGAVFMNDTYDACGNRFSKHAVSPVAHTGA